MKRPCDIKYCQKKISLLTKLVAAYKAKYEPEECDIDTEPLKPNFRVGLYTKKEDSTMIVPVIKELSGEPTGGCTYLFDYYHGNGRESKIKYKIYSGDLDRQIRERNILPSKGKMTKLGIYSSYRGEDYVSILVPSYLIRKIIKENKRLEKLGWYQ